jgi:hypothetical protein
MPDNFKESLEGAGIGLLGGIVIGISEADWFRVTIALALIAYTGKNMIGIKQASSGHSNSTTFTGIAAFIALFLGLYINGQQLFRKTPKTAISEWIDAGYSPSQAQALYLKQLEAKVDDKSAVSPVMQSLIHSVLTPSVMDSLKPGKDSISKK